VKAGTMEGLHARTACVLSNRYRFIYLTTAKNATSTLRAELSSERCGGVVVARATVAPQFWNDYFTFAFLRDPVERFLSAYTEISLRMERGEEELRPFAVMPDDLRRFQTFLRDLVANGPWNEHIAPQSAFVEGRRVDFWGTVETIQEDLQSIYTKLGIGPCPVLPVRRSRENQSTASGINRYVVHQRDLGRVMIERIRELYSEDAALIRSVRPDRARFSRSSAIRASPTDTESVQLGIALADGSEYSVELPSNHPALPNLLAYNDPGEPPLPAQVHQIPLNHGETALTFSSRHLVSLSVRPHARRAATPAVPAEGADRSAIKPDNDVAAIGQDPQINLEEGHLGGYLRAISAPARNSASSPHGDSWTWYPLLWRWLIEDLGVRSMLDVGCGEGHAARFFRDAGCGVLGVDGSLLARGESVLHGEHRSHDFEDGPFVPDRTFDLAWSCEFVEHVEERFVHNFLATFAASHKYLLMTYARPNQKGWHHVNCRTERYWTEKLQRLGFDVAPDLTQTARKLAGGGHFHTRGLVLVRRADRTATSFIPGAGAEKRAVEPVQDPAPVRVNSMLVAKIDQREFFLFHDIFVHATRPTIVAVCSFYGDDWNPADHGVDYDAVDLVLGDRRIRASCIRHRLDSWEPCMLLEFEAPELDAVIQAQAEITFTIEAAHHSRDFTVTTQPMPSFDVAMSLVVRDENRWIRTFLEYYLHCLEVSHIFVYDHATEDRDELLSILAPYRRRGLVTYIPWDFRWRNRLVPKMTAQPAQEAHSLARFANSRWIGFLDVDEFLRLPNTTAPAFLERFAGASIDGLSFGLRWFSYRGPLGFDEVDDAPLNYLYSRRDPLGRKRQKLFVKGGDTRFLRLHWLEDGRCELPVDDSDIFFHHYEQRPGRFDDGKKQAAEYDDYMLRFRDRLSLSTVAPKPIDEHAWIEHIESAFSAAQRCQSKLTDQVLAIDGMCGRYTRHFYNNLCGFEGCRFLEIGSYHGASACAAIYQDDVTAVCIDNWSQFLGTRRSFNDAIRRFGGRSTVEVFEHDCFDVDTSRMGPFDVYLYDGNHSEADQYRALQRFESTLADYAVVVIDDWSRPDVRKGTQAAIRDLGLDVRYEKEIVPASGESADEDREAGARRWWNGMYAMLIRFER